MALGGIGEGGGSPLDRFQQIRDLAKRKLDAEDSRTRLADVLKRKQAQLGGLAPDRPQGPQGPQAAGRGQAATAAGAAGGIAAAGGLSAYGRAGAAAGKPDPRPGLGRHIDLTA
jgi:hypothetical protein